MLTITVLRGMAKNRLHDAEVLYEGECWDGSVYLCGYAVELALKAKVCETLRWRSFPNTNTEFEGFTSFKTHDLDRLLRLSGVERKMKDGRRRCVEHWFKIVQWDPEDRYNPSVATKNDAKTMLESSREIISTLSTLQ